MNSRVVFHDLFPNWGISIDAKGTIHDIHKLASIYGGRLTVYDMNGQLGANESNPYRLSYRLNKPPFDFFVYGIELTEDEYNTQILAWNNNHTIELIGKSEITLIDNAYLLIRSDNILTNKFDWNV